MKNIVILDRGDLMLNYEDEDIGAIKMSMFKVPNIIKIFEKATKVVFVDNDLTEKILKQRPICTE